VEGLLLDGGDSFSADKLMLGLATDGNGLPTDGLGHDDE
jgi:hypothetical protein